MITKLIIIHLVVLLLLIDSVFWMDQMELLTKEKEALLLVLEESRLFMKSGDVNLIKVFIKAVSTFYSSMIYNHNYHLIL